MVTLIWLAALDRIAGPLPRTDADVKRERDWERLQKAFPGFGLDGLQAPSRPSLRL
jgi:hypothetical protein